MGVANKVKLRRIPIETLSWPAEYNEDFRVTGDLALDNVRDSVSVGDLRTFRYVDADSYDPNGWEVYIATVISIEIDPVDEYASIDVLCQDGEIRTFLDYEIHYETGEEYLTRLGEARPLNYYGETNYPKGEEAGAP